jgi:hypothetical protein
MNAPTSNIEAVARGICEKLYADDETLTANVDRYWHCVTAELEAGLIDEAGVRIGPADFDDGLEAYRGLVQPNIDPDWS